MNQSESNRLKIEIQEHLKEGRARIALNTARKLYKEKEEDGEAAILLAWAYIENGLPVKAMDYANLALELEGDDIKIHLIRGYVLMRMSIFEGALADLDKTIDEQKDLLAWTYMSKARSYAGMNRFTEAKKALDLSLMMDYGKHPDWKKNKLYFVQAEKISKKQIHITVENIEKVIKEAEEAIKDKEYWFALFIAETIQSNDEFKKFHSEIELTKLESMLKMNQVRPALDLAKKIKDKFSKDSRFKKLYSALKKSHDLDVMEEKELSTTKKESIDNLRVTKETFTNGDKYSDDKKQIKVAYYPNDYADTFSIKIYDTNDEEKGEKKPYFNQLNLKRIKSFGAEIIFGNPLFRIKTVDLNCTAVWYLRDFEVYRNQFMLNVNKAWDSVIFSQTANVEDLAFWKEGQAKVEIYIEGFKACEKWFFVDRSAVLEEIESKPKKEEESPIEDSKATEEEPKTEYPVETRSLEELLEELDSFIGLERVKKSVRDFIDFLEFQKKRKEFGLKSTEGLAINAIFTGNPGTGKTTIARLIGGIFKAMGIVPKGHVVEVDRAALVGQYIGETAQKTEKMIEEAMGGILFIDEAYTLVKKGGSGQDFGQEAIDVLLKRMEDKKGDFVVIAAGYPEEMEGFLSSNPGMKSRFNHTFHFEDYTPDELLKILKMGLNKEEYSIEDDAKELLNKEFTNLYRKRDKTFGNARLVRQSFEKLKLQLSKRYIGLSEEEQTKEAMTSILLEDVREILKPETEKNVKLPINEEELSEALNELTKLVGLESVKNDIKDLVKLVRYFIEQGEDVKEKFSSHILFLGNPGTGKTTAARIVSRIYAALGILPKGHLVEIDRQGLVGSHVGETAPKTTAIIDKSIGGTLFIDEAYTLAKSDSQSDFGKEAIDTLLKRMEDDRGKFIVIAAGYTNEMQNFIESNPGIQSRFTKTFTFEDYTPDELMDITNRVLAGKKIALSAEAKSELDKHYNSIYRNRDKNFGNARIVRGIIDNAFQKRLLRLADLTPEEREDENHSSLTEDDIKLAIGQPAKAKSYEVKGDPQKLQEALDELKQLTGLDSVKANVDKLINGLKVSKMRKERGMKIIEKPLHSVFTGNPGTGKTTVARLISKIYKELGLLEKGHLVEVDRSDLVAGYQGQTAIKTEKIIEQSLGGTLFIDEAYTLSRGGNDFGQEAIDTLLKQMEDHRGELVVIVAGYTNEMKQFLASNPGLQSRFPNVFDFEDYNPRQLLSISVNIADSNGYKLDEGALQVLMEHFTDLYEKRDKNFGNARTARNVLYKAISHQEERVSSMYDYSDDDLMTIKLDDVEKLLKKV